MRRLQLLLTAALLVLAFGLVACGGGDDGDGEEDRIVEVIETSATSTDPADCKRLATLKFLEQTEVAEGTRALENCEEGAKDTADDPDSVEVSEVEVDGSAATAQVAFTGGNFDSQALDVALVEEGGSWKLNEITGFVDLDVSKLGDSLEEALQEEGSVEQEVATCTGEAIRQLPPEQAEELMLGGSAGPLIEIIEDCAKG